MANEYLNEQEQLQVVKEWLKKYGVSILIGIVIALIGSYGYRYWRQHQLLAAQRASIIYEQMLASEAKEQPKQSQQFAEQLIQQYSHTPYADLAALTLAKNAITHGQADVAMEKLAWVTKHARDKSLSQIARLRTARILIAQNQPAKALTELETVDSAAFQPAIDEVRGDALAEQGKTSAARAAYQAALATMPASAMDRMWLQMKFDQLADSSSAN